MKICSVNYLTNFNVEKPHFRLYSIENVNITLTKTTELV